MKRFIYGLMAALALCLPGTPVLAQATQAQTVSACGTPNNTPVVGVPYPVTQDTTGKLCTSGTSGGGGASYTAAAAPFSVSAGTNKPAGIDTANSAQFTELVIPGTTTAFDPTATSTVQGAGTAGTADTHVLTVQGIANGTPAPVSISQATPGTTNAVQQVPGTTGGLSSFVLEPAASDNHTVIKNGAGQVYGIHVWNNSATINYGRLYNAGTGFNGCNSATNLAYEFQIPANSTNDAGFVVAIPDGLAFATGISLCVTGTYGQTSVANATASAISLNVLYK